MESVFLCSLCERTINWYRIGKSPKCTTGFGSHPHHSGTVLFLSFCFSLRYRFRFGFCFLAATWTVFYCIFFLFKRVIETKLQFFSLSHLLLLLVFMTFSRRKKRFGLVLKHTWLFGGRPCVPVWQFCVGHCESPPGIFP